MIKKVFLWKPKTVNVVVYPLLGWCYLDKRIRWLQTVNEFDGQLYSLDNTVGLGTAMQCHMNKEGIKLLNELDSRREKAAQ